MAAEPAAFPEIPPDLLERARRWPDLKRWERREVGVALRSLGLSYREISEIVPVAKGTLSGWCRDVPLDAGTRLRLNERTRARTGHHLGALRNRLKREVQIAAIRGQASTEVPLRARSLLWLAGVMLYWAEGSKGKAVRVTNSDPRLIALMMRWFRQSLGISNDRFTVRLHLHTGQDEDEARTFWSAVTGVPRAQFGKTFWKAEGSGHRKNVLHRGTAQVVVRRSGDLLHTVLAWIDACYHSDGPLAKLDIAADS